MIPTGGVSALSFWDTATGKPSELQRYDYDELSTRRDLLNRKLSELRFADEQRLLQQQELSDVHNAAMKRVAERRRKNDEFAKNRNKEFLAKFDEAIKRLDGEPLKRGPMANHSQSSKADLQRALTGFYEGVANLQPQYQQQMEQWRLDEIRELERQKVIAEQRRMVSKLAFEKEREITAAVAKHRQELAIAEVKEQGEALERHIFRKEEEKENNLIQHAIGEAARNTLLELHHKELQNMYPQAAQDGDIPLKPTAQPSTTSLAATDRQMQALQNFVEKNFGELLRQNRQQQQPQQSGTYNRPVPPPRTQTVASAANSGSDEESQRLRADELVNALAEAADATEALANEAEKRLERSQNVAAGVSESQNRPMSPDIDATTKAAIAQLSEGDRQVQELSAVLDETDDILNSSTADDLSSDQNAVRSSSQDDVGKGTARQAPGPWEAAVAAAGAASSLQLQSVQPRVNHEGLAETEDELHKNSILAELDALERQQRKLKAQIFATEQMSGGWANPGPTLAAPSHSQALVAPAYRGGVDEQYHSHDLTSNAIQLLNQVGSFSGRPNQIRRQLQQQRPLPPISARSHSSLGARLTQATPPDYSRHYHSGDASESFTDDTAIDSFITENSTDLSLDLELSADELATKLAKISQELVSLNEDGRGGSLASDTAEDSLHYDDSFDAAEALKAQRGATVGSIKKIEEALDQLASSTTQHNPHSSVLSAAAEPGDPHEEPLTREGALSASIAGRPIHAAHMDRAPQDPVQSSFSLDSVAGQQPAGPAYTESDLNSVPNSSSQGALGEDSQGHHKHEDASPEDDFEDSFGDDAETDGMLREIAASGGQDGREPSDNSRGDDDDDEFGMDSF